MRLPTGPARACLRDRLPERRPSPIPQSLLSEAGGSTSATCLLRTRVLLWPYALTYTSQHGKDQRPRRTPGSPAIPPLSLNKACRILIYSVLICTQSVIIAYTLSHQFVPISSSLPNRPSYEVVQKVTGCGTFECFFSAHGDWPMETAAQPCRLGNKPSSPSWTHTGGFSGFHMKQPRSYNGLRV